MYSGLHYSNAANSLPNGAHCRVVSSRLTRDIFHEQANRSNRFPEAVVGTDTWVNSAFSSKEKFIVSSTVSFVSQKKPSITQFKTSRPYFFCNAYTSADFILGSTFAYILKYLFVTRFYTIKHHTATGFF